MEDRYVFLRTTEVDGRPVALIGDQKVLGDGGVKSLRQAFAAHATPRTRAGVLTFTAEQLRERLPELEKHEMPQSVAAFTRALECVDKKSNAMAINAGAPAPHKINI